MKKIKFAYFLLILWLLLAVLCFDAILDTGFLILRHGLLLTSDFNGAISAIDLSLIDYYFSFFALFVFPFVLSSLYKKTNLPNIFCGWANVSVALLSVILIFAPLISNENPDFQKNLRMTKLLPPMSSVTKVYLINKPAQTYTESFIQLKNEIAKQSFNENIVFADSLILSEKIIVYQKGNIVEFEKSELKMGKGVPKTETKRFILGTDEYGRDIFARLIFGTRISSLIALGSVLISVIIGILLGTVSGLMGGAVDRIFSRLADMFLAFPILFFIVLIIALFGTNIFSVVVVLGFSGWMSLFKIVKSEVVSLKNKDYFLAAQKLGLSKRQLLFNEILPVISVPIIVNVIFQFGNVILAESALSYLGLGVGSEYPSWGAMIQAGQAYMFKAWWMLFFPSLFLVATLLTADNLGKKVNKFLNPNLNR